MTLRPLDPTELKADRILVVVPHPDDESLGCGGLLWHFARHGRLVHFAFVTDGGASHRNSPSWSRDRLAAERAQEAGEALRRLGHGQAPRSFLGLRDADMPVEGDDAFATALTEAAALVSGFRPDLALLPWRRDPHRDHRDSWLLFQKAFARSGIAPETLEYAIWLDEIGGADDHPRADEMAAINVAIGPALEAKRHAVAAHRTQTGHVIHDDETAFRLTETTIDRLVQEVETYWRPLP